MVVDSQILREGTRVVVVSMLLSGRWVQSVPALHLLSSWILWLLIQSEPRDVAIG